ncbi:MAG TPA: hypothetical protein VII11_05680, partial [Bacteroidota bacterium]
MKKRLLSILSLSLMSSVAMAQLFQARLVSSAYAWQRQDTADQSSNHLYGHQTVQFSLAGKTLSLHTYVQGFNDLAGPVKYDPKFRLYNFYVKASNLFDMVNISVGRQTVFAGVGVGSMDGGLVSAKFLDSKVRVLGYYGVLPPPQQKVELIGDTKNNFMTGGQVIVSPLDEAQLSVSYMRRNIQPEAYTAFRRDSLFNPYQVEIKPSASAEEYLSGDLNVELNHFISGYARYDYDMKFEKSSRVQLFTRVKVLEDLGLTGEYIYREPRLSYNSIFSVFTYNTLNEYEFGVEYAIAKPQEIFSQAFAKYGSVSYGDEDSKRVTLGVSGAYGSASLTRNLGYGGELSAASVSAGYPLFERTVMPTLLLSYAQYKLSENAGLENALSVAPGVVYRPSTTLSFDAQVQWIQNKIYQNDVRFFVR